jgi:hypothetical protein
MENLLKTYYFEDKIRLGDTQDGGYVICNIDNYDCYISAGVSDHESFTRDFINKYKTLNNFAFDGTINDYPWKYTKNINFFKKNINGFNDNFNTDLSFLASKYDNIFLKMDIEGYEFPWINSHIDLNKFKQIVIEFHCMNNDNCYTFDYNYDDKLRCFEKLNKTHYLFHAHGNNCCTKQHENKCQYIENGNYFSENNVIPDVIELTYVNKKIFKDVPKFNKKIFPISGLDYKNCTLCPEIILNNYPFIL